MPKKRRLTDLYVIGEEVSFPDGDNDPITVFVRKLNPVDHDTALRSANAARSRAAAIKSDTEGDEYQLLHAVVLNYDRESLVTYLAEDLRSSRRPIVEARTADDELWKDNGYLQGLQDAWSSKLDAVWAEDNNDPEALRVKTELDRYNTDVNDQLEAEVDDLLEVIKLRSTSELQDQVFQKVLDVRASIAWLTEYRRCEVWLSTREPDRKTRYFESRTEFEDLSGEVYERLSNVYLGLSVEPTEGKDSAVTPLSSLSSAPQDTPETDEASGPTIVAE